MVIAEELRAFFGKRRSDLVRFAALQLRDPVLAEDVVQETLVAVECGAGDFAGRSSAKTWVYSILKRKIVDALRSRRETPISKLGNAEGDEADLDALFDQRGHWASAASLDRTGTSSAFGEPAGRYRFLLTRTALTAMQHPGDGRTAFSACAVWALPRAGPCALCPAGGTG
jgi:RNA polymerase sigma factor (sigma-70 family)